MTQDRMNYNQMVEQALRGVVRQALQRVAEDGLPGTHHFYIGFRTGDPGVEMPEHLRARYPDEMTIVLQHQFWGLQVDEDAFSVSLSFNKRPELLHIPYSAISSFFDPAVQFGLQFKPADGDGMGEATTAGLTSMPLAGDDEAAVETAAEAAELADGDGETAPEAEAADDTGGQDNIVTLDSFRRK